MNLKEAKTCLLFACVYATKSGCSINGWMDNGEKEYCLIYDIKCITAKCRACGHEGEEGCIIGGKIEVENGI